MLLRGNLVFLSDILQQLCGGKTLAARLDGMGVEFGQLEQVAHQPAQSPRVAQSGVEIGLPFGGRRAAGFQLQRFQIAVQRGQRRAQIVRNVVDQFAPQRIALPQGADQRLQMLGHPVEMQAELFDFVALGTGTVIGRPGRKLALLESIDHRRQPPQPPGQQPEQQQAGQQTGQQTTGQHPGAEPQQQAVPVQALEGLVHLAAQHHVQIAFGRFGRRNGRDRETFAGIVAARIVAEDRQLGAAQECPDRFQRHPVAFDRRRLGGVGENRALSIQPIDFDAGIDGHVTFESGLQRLGVEPTVGDQPLVGDQVAGQIAIETLLRFLEITLGQGVADQAVAQADGAQQRHQRHGQLAVQGVQHDSANL